MKRVDLFVFDLAGTLARDDRQVQRAFQAVAESHDLEVSVEDLRRRHGWHKERVFRSLLTEHGRSPPGAPAMAKSFEREFGRIVAGSPLRPTHGALATLRTLRDAGVKLACNTGFSRSTADLVLGCLGLEHLPSVASDEVAAGRPAPDMILRAMRICGVCDASRVGVVGDTPADLAAGMAAGAGLVVGVGCGTHTLEELRAHPHTHLLADLSSLPALVLVP